jgi:hypothetical protein
MKASEARAYVQRWQAVEQLRLEKRRAATIQDNWRQLNLIRQRAIDLGLQPSVRNDRKSFHRLWAKLNQQWEKRQVISCEEDPPAGDSG